MALEASHIFNLLPASRSEDPKSSPSLWVLSYSPLPKKILKHLFLHRLRKKCWCWGILSLFCTALKAVSLTSFSSCPCYRSELFICSACNFKHFYHISLLSPPLARFSAKATFLLSASTYKYSTHPWLWLFSTMLITFLFCSSTVSSYRLGNQTALGICKQGSTTHLHSGSASTVACCNLKIMSVCCTTMNHRNYTFRGQTAMGDLVPE